MADMDEQGACLGHIPIGFVILLVSTQNVWCARS